MLVTYIVIQLMLSSVSNENLCWTQEKDTITSTKDLLSLFPACWVGQKQQERGVYLKSTSSGSQLTLNWEPCNFHANGFRTEIIEPYDAKFHAIKRKYSWQPIDQQYYHTTYRWKFAFEDSNNILKSWANGAFIAQIHSYSHPLDDSVKGGSPVVGLYLTKLENNDPDLYKLTLSSKVFRSTGFCDDKETPTNKGYCIKNLISYEIMQNENYNIFLEIKDNKSFNEPGYIKLDIENAKSQLLKPQHLDEDSYFRLPVRQNSQPNFFKIGWYVSAPEKKSIYTKKQNQDFCSYDGHLTMNISDFSFIKRK
ncbi:MAG: hypothetical protein OQJ80_03400 [Kangiella sp.]|nr:hypothetical protein [Kangiella sp.]